MGRYWAALGFLTIVPLPSFCRQTEEDLPRSVPLFPFVGLLIGLLTGGIAALCAGGLPPTIAAVAWVILLAVMHGGLHLDGLADTGDGFFSHRQRERILEIMRDNRIGAFGCLTVAGVLALKVAAVMSMSAPLIPKALLLAPLAGRCMMVPMLVCLPCARPDGMGHLFRQGRSMWEAFWALAILGLTAGLLARSAGIVSAGLVIFAMLGFTVLCRNRINGFTGDTLGASSEIAEMVMLVAMATCEAHGL